MRGGGYDRAGGPSRAWPALPRPARRSGRRLLLRLRRNLRAALQRASPPVAAAGQVSATAILALPFALLIEQPWAIRAGALTWSAIFGLAFLSTAAAYIIFFRILAAAGATNVMLVTFLIPVSALLLGVFALGERPAWTAFAGMGLIFTGLAGVDGRLLSRVGERGLPARLQFHSAGRLFTRVPLTSPRPDTKLCVRFWSVVRRTFIYKYRCSSMGMDA